jgi:hypothetical protein
MRPSVFDVYCMIACCTVVGLKADAFVALARMDNIMMLVACCTLLSGAGTDCYLHSLTPIMCLQQAWHQFKFV